MRIHSDTLVQTDILYALNKAKAAHNVAPEVSFKILTQHKSSSHANAYEVQLTCPTKTANDGRRAGNGGSYGASPDYAATYDEWGWFLAELFKTDPKLIVGTPNRPIYDGAENFHDITGMTYDPANLLDCLTDPHAAYDPYPYTNTKNKVGRYGANRISDNVSGHIIRYCTYAPRDAATYKAWAHA